MKMIELLYPNTSKRLRRGFTENDKTKPCPCCDGGKGRCSHGKSICGTCSGSGLVPFNHKAQDNDC